MMKHLINFHRPPLTLRVGRHTFHAPTILLPLLLREKLIAINSLHAECPRHIAGNRNSGDPEVASESCAKHIHEWISFLLFLPRERSYLILKPLAEGFDLLLRIRREQMLDGHVRRRNQNRFRVRESVKAVLAVVITDPGRSNTTEGHRFDKQMNVHLIDRAATE